MIQPSKNPSPSKKLPTEGGAANSRKTYPSADLIQHTIRVWEPRLGRTLTEEDARQILDSVVGAFRVLHGWDYQKRQPASGLKDKNDESG